MAVQKLGAQPAFYSTARGNVRDYALNAMDTMETSLIGGCLCSYFDVCEQFSISAWALDVRLWWSIKLKYISESIISS